MERKTKNAFYFWKGSNKLSNWYGAKFKYLGVEFDNSEAAFMFGKAIVFGDKESASKILINQQPSAAKAVGRAVRGFDETAWD